MMMLFTISAAIIGVSAAVDMQDANAASNDDSSCRRNNHHLLILQKMLQK
jgi:hypothetical protein